MIYDAFLLLVPFALALTFVIPAALWEVLMYLLRQAASWRETRYLSRHFRDPARREW